jgi:myo-inositol-1(or 4)-monophosphatase
VRGIRRLGSAAYDLCLTARGLFDGYWELNLQIWDIAAGVLIVEEAGGRVTSFRDDRSCSIVAASPAISELLLKELATTLKD